MIDEKDSTMIVPSMSYISFRYHFGIILTFQISIVTHIRDACGCCLKTRASHASYKRCPSVTQVSEKESHEHYTILRSVSQASRGVPQASMCDTNYHVPRATLFEDLESSHSSAQTTRRAFLMPQRKIIDAHSALAIGTIQVTFLIMHLKWIIHGTTVQVAKNGMPIFEFQRTKSNRDQIIKATGKFEKTSKINSVHLKSCKSVYIQWNRIEWF